MEFDMKEFGRLGKPTKGASEPLAALRAELQREKQRERRVLQVAAPLVVVAAGLLWLLPADGETEAVASKSATLRVMQAQAMAPAISPEATPACNTTRHGILAVTASYDMRSAPDEEAARLVNEKATAILGDAHYHSIDRSTTVRELCVEGSWSKIRTVSPEWLVDLEGWVPSRYLRGTTRSGSNKQIFVEDDFHWDGTTSPWKSEIVEVVNAIQEREPSCVSADPMSASRSGSKGTATNPVFFVACQGSSGLPFNVWFRPDGTWTTDG